MAKREKNFLKDRRGLSSAIITIILIALAVAIIATAYKYANSIKPSQISSASLSISDDPRSLSDGYAIDIKMTTGNPIPLYNLKLNVYYLDASGRAVLKYSKKIVNDNQNYEITDPNAQNGVTTIDQSDATLNPGDVLYVKSGAGFDKAGNYIVEIYDGETLLAQRTIYVS